MPSVKSEERLSIITGPKTPPVLDWTFNDVLNKRCATHAQHVALICPQQNLRYTFTELQQRTLQLAFGLHKLGVKAGDRVALLLGNRAEYVEVRATIEETSWTLFLDTKLRFDAS